MVDITVPAAPPSSSLRRVELAHTGQWRIGSGLWNASREDFVAAVAALDCPAVRRPVLKLGHSQGDQPLWAGNPTGEPAVGWVDNLATTNSGHTLVGDFVDMPGWFGGIAASAYPDRSIEGTHDFRCQIGHTHPFVVTAVALLGVTRPGVGTLKSLQDVGRLYGVQAASDGGTRVVARFDPGQLRWPEGAPGGLGGQWRDETPDLPEPNADADTLKLAGRIQLGQGERLLGSAAVDAGGDTVVPLAAVDGPDGRRLRIGTGILGEDRSRWSGANLGHTANLGPDGVAELQDTLGTLPELARVRSGRWRELSGQLDALGERERELIRAQHPNLSKTRARQLDRLDEQIEDLRFRAAGEQRSIDSTVGRLPAELQDRYRQAGPGERQQIVRQWYGTHPEWRGVGIGRLHEDRMRRLAGLQAELADAQRRRDELAGPAVPLSAQQQADLDRLRLDRQLVEQQLDDLVDQPTEGEIAGDWADLTYRLDLQDETGEPRVTLAARPHANPDAVDTETTFDMDQLAELAVAVDRLLGGRAVEAHHGWLDDPSRPGSVQAHLPGQHNQQTHGRRYGPGGELLRGPRRLVRATRRQTVRALNRTLTDLAGDEAATRPGMTGGPLVDLVAGIRDGVDGGQFTPEQALQLLSSLVFRPDVASNPRLSTSLGDLTGQLRDGNRREAPDMPDVADVAEPTVPDPVRVGPLRRTRAPGEVADDLPQQLLDATSSDRARELLAGLTAAQLRTVADEVGAAYATGWRKQRIADSIVRRVAGFRETFDAIERLGGPGAGQLSAAADVEAQDGRNQLKHYWTRDPRGLARWATKPHPWTALFRELREHVGSARAKRIASQWFKEVFGIWPGERKGKNPLGPG